jgi:hypothetical protein
LPNQLVTSCIYGWENVGHVIMRKGTPAEECAKMVNQDETANVGQASPLDSSNALAKQDACVAGAKAFVHNIFQIRTGKSVYQLEDCERVTGQGGLNPKLACH